MVTPVDWSAPWFEPLRSIGEPIWQRSLAGLPLHESLNRAATAPVRFIPQSAAPSDVPYERYVFESGCCPTRDNLHDFFNGLAWHAFPLSKRRLNELQAGQIAALGPGAARGPVRDAITVFDENGALLAAPPALWEALRAREWRRLFVDLRPLWREARLCIFGHALLEQLANPRKGLTAHVWRADAALDSGAAADAWLAARCVPEVLAGKPFTPLPVLGIPGWWPGNENFSFYDDSLVFRPRKTQNPEQQQRPRASSRS